MPVFDFNSFKKSVKQWIREHPEGSLHELRDYCEELIPPNQYTVNNWVVDQTVSWYRHILDHREFQEVGEDDELVD